MLVGYMRVSSESDRQTTNLQRDALQATGIDLRHLFEDRASGAKDDRAGLTKAFEFVRSGDVLSYGSWTDSGAHCRICSPS